MREEQRSTHGWGQALARWPWLPTLVAAVLAALAGVIGAILQGGLAAFPTVIAGAVGLIVIYVAQSLVERRRSDDRQVLLTPDALQRQTGFARADLVEQLQSEEWASAGPDRPLGGMPGIPIRLRLAPGAVDPAFSPNLPDRAITLGTPVRDLYEQVRHQMLVLGEPGAGKTTLLFELARSLLEEALANEDARVPVVFRLPSWAVDRRPLEDWMVAALSRSYGVNRIVGRHWIEMEHVIPLLDGLDEVAAEHREACLDAINAFHGRHGQLPLVVCSRIQEYEELSARLRLRGALVIEPLTRREVLDYVQRARLTSLHAALEQDPRLGDLITTPLLIGLSAAVYQRQPPSRGREDGPLLDRRGRLLEDYVDAMLGAHAERDAPYPPEPSKRWLAWLARAMREHGQTIFHADRLGPDWLSGVAPQWMAPAAATAVAALLQVVIAALAAALVVGIAVLLGGRGLPGISSDQLTQRLPRLALLMVAAGLAMALAVHERAIEPIYWSRATFRRTLPGAAGSGTAAGALLGAAVALRLLPPAPGELAGLAVLGGLVGLLTGAGYALAAAYERFGDATPGTPGQAIPNLLRTARLGAVVGPLVLCPVLAAAATLGIRLATGQASWQAAVLVAVFAAPPVALFTALRQGGAAYLRHRAVLWLLAREDLVPPDLPAFLAHAARVKLLRRRLGGYEFVHPLLRQHLAARPQEKGQDRGGEW